MKPRIKLAESSLSGGGQIALFVHDGDYTISFNGQELMHSKASLSEYRLGQHGIENTSTTSSARILIGGLGLGYTLQGVAEVSAPEWEILVAELVPEVVEWNCSHLYEINGRLLDDPRVKVIEADVVDLIRDATPESHDAILLDIDNGPVAMVSAGNQFLYSPRGISAVYKALKPGGRAIFWSTGPDSAFEARLRNRGFAVKRFAEKRHHAAKRPGVSLFIADRGKV